MITTLPKYAGVEQNQTPPVGPTYKYGEKKRKERGELQRSAGKQFINTPNTQ